MVILVLFSHSSLSAWHIFQYQIPFHFISSIRIIPFWIIFFNMNQNFSQEVGLTSSIPLISNFTSCFYFKVLTYVWCYKRKLFPLRENIEYRCILRVKLFCNFFFHGIYREICFFFKFFYQKVRFLLNISNFVISDVLLVITWTGIHLSPTFVNHVFVLFIYFLVCFVFFFFFFFFLGVIDWNVQESRRTSFL